MSLQHTLLIKEQNIRYEYSCLWYRVVKIAHLDMVN